jgi:hypothetical protein
MSARRVRGMSLRHVAFLAAFVGALTAPGIAHAAPGDCQILAGNPVCEPYPTSNEPPYYSVCTVIDSPSALIRKSCQTFLQATGEAVGDPKIFVYPPTNTLTAPPSPTPQAATPVVSRSVSTSNQPAPPAPDPADRADLDAQSGPTPTAEADLTGTDAGLLPESAGIATGAAPSTSEPFVPNGQGTPANQPASNRVPMVIAGIALLFLIGACVWRPRGARKGAHREGR